MIRPHTLSALVFVTLAMALFASRGAEAADQYRRWRDDGKTYSCTSLAGGGARVQLSQQNVEFANLPADAQFTIHYIENGVDSTSGPFPVEQTSGTRSYGSFVVDFPAYPLDFEFRLDTLIDGAVVYESSVIVRCSGNASGPVDPVQVDLGGPPQFRRWLDNGKTFTCTKLAGGTIQLVLSNQAVEFSNLPADAQFMIHYIENGVDSSDGPFTVEQTSGTRSYGAFATNFPSYPLTFQFRLDTLVDGRVVYRSELAVACNEDGSFAAPPAQTPVASEVPMLAPAIRISLGLMLVGTGWHATRRARRAP